MLEADMLDRVDARTLVSIFTIVGVFPMAALAIVVACCIRAYLVLPTNAHPSHLPAAASFVSPTVKIELVAFPLPVLAAEPSSTQPAMPGAAPPAYNDPNHAFHGGNKLNVTAPAAFDHDEPAIDRNTQESAQVETRPSTLEQQSMTAAAPIASLPDTDTAESGSAVPTGTLSVPLGLSRTSQPDVDSFATSAGAPVTMTDPLPHENLEPLTEAILLQEPKIETADALLSEAVPLPRPRPRKRTPSRSSHARSEPLWEFPVLAIFAVPLQAANRNVH
jgi:hypothetical protein